MFDVFTSAAALVTRSFVRDVVDRELPAALLERLRAPPAIAAIVPLVHPD